MNKDNEKFIEWAMEYVADEDRLFELKTEALAKFSQFLDLRGDQIAELLKRKLIRGGLEYDITKFDVSRLDQEIQDEHTDLLGWRLIGMYLNQNIDK